MKAVEMFNRIVVCDDKGNGKDIVYLCCGMARTLDSCHKFCKVLYRSGVLCPMVQEAQEVLDQYNGEE